MYAPRNLDVLREKDVYCTALAYMLKCPHDDVWPNMYKAEYGGSTCWIANTRYGKYAQPEPGVFIAMED